MRFHRVISINSNSNVSINGNNLGGGFPFFFDLTLAEAAGTSGFVHRSLGEGSGGCEAGLLTITIGIWKDGWKLIE